MLTQAIITQKDWEEVSYYIVLIILMVMAMDSLSGWLRSTSRVNDLSTLWKSRGTVNSLLYLETIGAADATKRTEVTAVARQQPWGRVAAIGRAEKRAR